MDYVKLPPIQLTRKVVAEQYFPPFVDFSIFSCSFSKETRTSNVPTCNYESFDNLTFLVMSPFVKYNNIACK